MDLAPANILLANAELELIFTELREFRLKEVLAPLLDNYDFILIDCPPSLGILSIISLVASTHVLVPIQCQFKALKGTDSLLKTVARVQRQINRSLKIAGFFPTMYSASNSRLPAHPSIYSRAIIDSGYNISPTTKSNIFGRSC